MSLSKEEQRNKHRQQSVNENKYKVKRLINGRVKYLTRKQNKNYNWKKFKPPTIYMGLNTTK